MNDQALINVIHAKKNRYFIGLKHAAKLGSKGGKQKSLFPYVFLRSYKARMFLLGMEIRGSKYKFSL